MNQRGYNQNQAALPVPQSASFFNSTPPTTKLILNYLPPDMHENEIGQLFSSIGNLMNVKLMRDKRDETRSLAYAFVEYERLQDAQEAVRMLNGIRVRGKSLKVSFSQPQMGTQSNAINLYVSGLPKDINEEALQAIFGKFGPIVSVFLLNKESDSMQYKAGFVRFAKQMDALKAIIELNDTTPANCTRPIHVKIASTNKAKSLANGGGIDISRNVSPQDMMMSPGGMNISMPFPNVGGAIRPNFNRGMIRYSPMNADGLQAIFVYNLEPTVKDSELWQLFGPHGAVQSVKIVRNSESNECKGYAFVTMLHYEEALAAINALNGYQFQNRMLQVRFHNKQRKPQYNGS